MMRAFAEQFLSAQQVTGMIFDVDGTLLDSMPVWNHSGERYLASFGIGAPPSLNDILFTMTMRRGAEYMKKTFKLQQEPQEIAEGINQMAAADYRDKIQPKPGMPGFLDALWDAGIPMAVVTSTDRPLIDAAFTRLGLSRYFQAVMTCSEFGSGKDRPQIFHAAAHILNSPPSSTWVVEDGLYAVRTAKAAGYRVIGVFDAASADDEPMLRRLSDYFIKEELRKDYNL